MLVRRNLNDQKSGKLNPVVLPSRSIVMDPDIPSGRELKDILDL